MDIGHDAMKCPKCGYLGFEDVDRCRNCGYDFSLLPLFELPDIDDAPLITRASPPRKPLAVRRPTPEVPRLRSSHPRTPMLDLGPDRESLARSIARESSVGQPADGHGVQSAVESSAEPAGVAARASAAAIDLAILAAIDVAVIYLTMQVCGVTVGDFRVLPKGPLFAFLAAQNLGYLVGFTVGGQTLGKMAAGIKVVSTSGNAALDLGHSMVRALVWIVLAVPVGLGFATALFGPDRRGLHDRCAGTKVVRAST
jgi:uncharacterized RDD family membrane protein YckC